MIIRIVFVISVVFVISASEAFVRRDVTPTAQPLEAFQQNLDQFRHCIDQSFAKTVGELNEKQLQPLFNVISDHLSRLSKAFEDLTAPRSTSAIAAA